MTYFADLSLGYDGIAQFLGVSHVSSRQGEQYPASVK